jgi:hypothetical protein
MTAVPLVCHNSPKTPMSRSRSPAMKLSRERSMFVTFPGGVKTFRGEKARRKVHAGPSASSLWTATCTSRQNGQPIRSHAAAVLAAPVRIR